MLHGTTQSPTGWERLNAALAARGHQCQSVDLTKVAADSPAVVYAEDLAEKLGVTSPVVVAHSGSGLLLPLIARALHAIHQVFLAAWIPNGKQSLIAELDVDPTGIFHGDWRGKDPTGDADVARHFLFHDCDVATTIWALSTLRPFDLGAVYGEVVPLAAEIPATVIVPEADRTLRAEWMCQASRERLGVKSIVIPGGHCPHVSRPDTVADLLSATP